MTTSSKTPPDDEAIKKLLEQLRSKESHRRWEAAKSLAEINVNNAEIINALEAVAASDSTDIVREAAEEALIALEHTPPTDLPPAASAPPPAPPPKRPFYKQRDFWLGFVGWYVVNGILWGIAMVAGGGITLNYFVLPINLIILLIAAFKRRRFAGGMLAAIALNFVIALSTGAFFHAICAIPFFLR